MITITRIRIQTLNGDMVTRQQSVTNCHTFASRDEMEQWRMLKEMKLQFKESQRHQAGRLDPEHCPKVYVALDYKELP